MRSPQKLISTEPRAISRTMFSALHAWIADLGQIALIFGVVYSAWRSYKNGVGISDISTKTNGMQTRLEEAARAQERVIASETAAPDIRAAEARGRVVGAEEEAARTIR